jgi:virginiamycin B lyase
MDQAAVFISYSRKQFYVAEHLARALEQRGLSPWLDVQKILPGVDWQASIDQGLATCQALVLVASRSAYQSAAVQYEVSTARAAGKPIYLAVIEDTPFVAELRAVATVIDCQERFSSGVAAIVQALQTGKLPKKPFRRAHPWSLRMPFGRSKYLQLLCLCLCYLLGTSAILLRKQVIISGSLNDRFLPFLALAIIPAILWVVSFVYSLLLLRAFRRQGRVTYLALELWPMLNIFLFPLLFNTLFFELSTQAISSTSVDAPNAFFNTAFSITDRAAGPTFGWQLLFFFSAAGLYLVFLSFTLRGWLIALGWIPLLVLMAISQQTALPGLVVPLGLLVIGGSIVFLSMRGFLNGQDVPVAFGEQEPKYTLSISFGKPAARHMPSSIIRESAAKPAPVNKFFPVHEARAWGRWLTPGAFPNEAFVRAYQATRDPAPASSAVKTWRLYYVSADVGSAQAIRRLLAEHPMLRESTSEQSDYQIAILSNKTPRRWVDTLAKRYPLLVCIMVSSLDFNQLASSLQQHQWIDYRQQRPYQIHNLAKALSGTASTINQTTPENFARTVGPYPFKLVVYALRMGSAACVVQGLAAQLIAANDRVTLVPFPLVVMSVVIGLWAWWEAGRLLARTTFLPELLLTWGALITLLAYWVVSGAVGTLLPREFWVRNGTYNSLLATGFIFLALFAGLPFLLFLVVAGVELVRNSGVLRRWLPRPDWPRWQRTLAVAPWRRRDVSLVLYTLAALTLIATLVVNSPYHDPHIHEYDVVHNLPNTLTPFHLSTVLAGPDGNIWFGTASDARYTIGSISPTGDVQSQRITIPEPAGCSQNTFACFSVFGLRFGPDYQLWYVAQQTFQTTEIQRATLAGNITRFPLPHRNLSNVTFAFDAAGNLWYTGTANALSDHQQAWIVRLAVTHSPGAITEFALPTQSLPTSIVAGLDGNLWFFDDGTHAIGKITPLGAITEYPLPYRGRLAGTAQEEMILGADRNLWFTDPQTGMVGRITPSGKITVYAGKANSNPRDLIAAPDGSIWFIDRGQQALGHIPLGGQLAFYPLHAPMSINSSLTIGPDGTIWVTLYNQIGRVTTAGAMTLYDVPTLDADLWGIVTGSDHHLWFVEYYPGIIGELAP